MVDTSAPVPGLRAPPGTLIRQAIQACPACGYVLPEELVRIRLERGSATARCPACEQTVISLVEIPVTPVEMAAAEMTPSVAQHQALDAVALRLKGKIETGDYDVFLCHNSKDKHQVKAIGEQIKNRGLLPWLDIWEIRPGTCWQRELQKRIKTVKSAAVFIGSKGPGPWQELEVEALLGEIAKRSRPIIPVILEGRQGRPRLPAFLDMRHMVDMRQPDPEPFEQLIWGITGDRSARS